MLLRTPGLFHPVGADCFHQGDGLFLGIGGVIVLHLAEHMTAVFQSVPLIAAADAQQPFPHPALFVPENVVVQIMQVKLPGALDFCRSLAQLRRMGKPLAQRLHGGIHLFLVHINFLLQFDKWKIVYTSTSSL